ncbi:MAG: tetratricopeptide repeat protein [Nitrospiraceae bacterium]|nr:tetratricopeptide repeat protein [Nitrospiraceae bacterium]
MADKTAIIREAQKYLARGQLDKAIAEWDKLIKESPDGNTYNTVGDLYLRKGDRKSAIESYHQAAGYFRREGFSLKALALYKKVLNFSQADADALYALGELSEEKGLTTDATKYYLAAADSLSKEGKKDRLLDIYQKILSLSPSNVPLRNKVAEIFLKEGLKSDAVKEYLSIARSYEGKGDIPKAREYYQKVTELNPMNKEAAIGIARLYEKSGEIGNAVAAMKEMAGLFPDDTDILLRYAELSLDAGNYETAEDCLRRVSQIEPDNMRARRLLGDVFLKKGPKARAWEFYLPVIDDMILQNNYDDPIRLLGSFRDIDPLETGRRLVSLYREKGEKRMLGAELVSLGDALKEKGLTDDALGCYREALEADPDDARVRELIGELEERPAEEKELEARIEPEAAEETTDTGVSEGGKTVEELLTEADIFSRYGLLSEAVKLLEGLKLRNPQNAEVHVRLKSLYADTSDKESAVTECLILSELYKRQGDLDRAEKELQEAAGIYPDDPRLAERGVIPQLEPTSYGAEPTPFSEAGTGASDIEDYEEEIAEADFYLRQGLTQEAAKILERLHTLFPENKEVAERLTNLGQLSEVEETPEMPPPVDLREEQEGGIPVESAGGTEETFTTAGAEIEMREEPRPEGELPEKQPPDEDFEDFTFSEQDLVDAQEMPEPELDNDVLEIFQEFKKGLEKELGDEDSETRYNLGIAYKEMGLIDDAIKEFQTSRNDPKRFLQSSTMLAVCYMEKGMYSLAIDVLGKVLTQISDRDDSYWSVKYDLAEAHEKNKNLREALDLYTEVFGWNARFRGVSEKVSQIGAQLGKSGAGEKPKPKKDRVSYL